MNIEIRKAELSDLDLLLKWRMTVLREVFSIPADRPTDELERENRRYYETALPDGAHIACFARSGDEIVGCGGVCVYRELPSPDNPNGYCGYIMNVYTSPEYRGRGVGRKVVNWLIEQSRKRGVKKIYLEASESGYPLYQKMGFVDMRGYMKLNE